MTNNIQMVMYENLRLNTMRQSTSLIVTGLILWLGVVTVLEFFLPNELFLEPGEKFSAELLEIGSPIHLAIAGKTIVGLIGITSLIAGITIYVQDKRKGTNSYFIVKNEPVDVKRQTFFACIPGLDLYASFKVKKLTMYFIVMIGIGFPIIILISYLPSFSFNYLIVESIVLPVAICLIRKWSKKWNEGLSNGASYGDTEDDISSRTAFG